MRAESSSTVEASSQGNMAATQSFEALELEAGSRLGLTPMASLTSSDSMDEHMARIEPATPPQVPSPPPAPAPSLGSSRSNWIWRGSGLPDISESDSPRNSLIDEDFSPTGNGVEMVRDGNYQPKNGNEGNSYNDVDDFDDNEHFMHSNQYARDDSGLSRGWTRGSRQTVGLEDEAAGDVQESRSTISAQSSPSRFLRHATGGTIESVARLAIAQNEELKQQQEQGQQGEGGSTQIQLEHGIPLFELYKATRQLKVQMKCVEGIIFFIFMVTFAFVFVEMRMTSLAGETTEALIDFFVEEEFVEIDLEGLDGAPFFRKTYRDLKTSAEWWQWALGPLSEGLWFNYENASLPPRGMPMEDAQNYILGGSQGGILFRTSRVSQFSCHRGFFQTHQMGSVGLDECYGPWPMIDAEDPNSVFEQPVISTEAYGLANVEIDPSNAPEALAQGAFEYTVDSGSTLEGTLLGQMYLDRNKYGRGGFMADFPIDNDNNRSTDALAIMYLNHWIDISTRIVSVEFNVYNPSTNVITGIRLFTEYSQTGNIRPSYRFYHINALMWHNLPPGYYVLIAVFLALLIAFTYKWLRRLITCRQWRSLIKWKIVFDTILLTLFWCSIITIIIITQTSKVIRESQFEETIASESFTPGIFESAERMHSVDALCSINLMLATVRLLSYLPFKTTRTIWATLGGAVKDVVVLGIVVLVFWAGFSLGSHLTFGSLGFFDFDRIDRTFGTLMVLMFSGDIDFNAMREVSFTAAPLFYSIYMIFMWGVMLNLFVAIIVLTYERYTQWQSNFETWSNLHHGTNTRSIIISWPEYVQHALWHMSLHMRIWIAKQQLFLESSKGKGTDSNSEEGASHPSNESARMATKRGTSGSNESETTKSLQDQSAQGAGSSGVGTPKLSRKTSVNKSWKSSRKLSSTARRNLLTISQTMFGRSRRHNRFEDDPHYFRNLFRTRATIVDLDKVHQDLAIVIAMPEEARLAELRRLGNPHKVLFQEIWRRFFWRVSVIQTTKRLEKIIQIAENESVVIRRWRREFDVIKGDKDSQITYSIWDRIMACFNHGCSQQKPAGDAAKDKNDAENTLTKLFFEDRKKASARYEQYRAVLSRERELSNARKRIEQLLIDTQNLFKYHSMSFNRVMRSTWLNTADDERLMSLRLSELTEMLSPGCKPHERCPLCERIDFKERAQDLLDHYTIFKKREKLVTDNRHRKIRVRRVGELFGRPPPPVQRSMSGLMHANHHK